MHILAIDSLPHSFEAIGTDPLAEPIRWLNGVNVTEALRLLQLAGIENPLADNDGETAALQRVVDGLCAVSSQDGLTGLANRRSFWNALESEIERSARTGDAFGLLLIDIDHFKQVNDAHGHPTGDVVLRAVAKVIESNFRPMDTVARIGGEEFAVILPNSPLIYSRQVAERVLARVARERIMVSPDLQLSVTVSIGVTCPNAWTAREAEVLMEAADHNLYQAKRQGRNRVCWEPQPSTALTSTERALLLGLAG